MHPTAENYKFLIETEWKDIHHSRIQEWSALGIIAAIHLGLIQFLKFIYDIQGTENLISILIPIVCLIALLFAFFGILMVCRHRRLMWIKLNWIYEAESYLGLIKTESNQKGIIPEDYRMEKYTNTDYQEIESAKIKTQSQPSKKNISIWNKLMWPRILSTSWLMAMLYILLGVIDLGIILFSVIIPV